MNSGVYIIENKKNGHRYVGSSVDIKRRWAEHTNGLRARRHENRHLQNAYNKYGKSVFVFEVLEEWEPEFLVSMEQWWMNMLAPEYNIAPVAGNTLAMTHTDEAKAKMSIAQRGNTNSLGHKHTTEAKAKMSVAKKGRKQSDEHKAKLSSVRVGKPAWNKGKKASATTKAKMSVAAMGNTRGGANKGREISAEHRAKISVALNGNTNGKLGNHIRWHVNRGIVNPDCPLCVQENK